MNDLLIWIYGITGLVFFSLFIVWAIDTLIEQDKRLHYRGDLSSWYTNNKKEK